MVELKPLNNGSGYYLWQYVPSVAAAGIFCVLFGVLTAAHTWRMFKTRAWFCVPFTIGCYFELIGYAARASAEKKTDELIPYIIQSIFILLGPALFAASIYMTLSRIINAINASHLSLIKPRWLTTIFVVSDVVSFLVQATGGGMMAQRGKAQLGQNITIAGLVIQVVMFGFFWVTAIILHARVRKNPTTESKGVDLKWEQYLYMLYTVSAFIMVRSIFRVIEFAMGNDGYLLAHEWPIYIFDAVLMWLVTVFFFWWYPSRVKQVYGRVDAEHMLQDHAYPPKH